MYISLSELIMQEPKMNRKDRPILGRDTFLTGLVLGYGNSTIEQVKSYTKLRKVSTNMKSIIDKHMTLEYEENCPIWLRPFQEAHVLASKLYFKGKLFPVKNTDETDADFNTRRKSLWSEAFEKMENVYFYPQASYRFFLYLDRFMDKNQNVEWAFASFPELVEGFVPRVLFYMQACRNDPRIQKLGCKIILRLELNERNIGILTFASIAMWTRMIDILEKHKKNNGVVMSVLDLYDTKTDKIIQHCLKDIQNPIHASCKALLVFFAFELEDVIKVYKNADVVITLDIFDHTDRSEDYTKKKILRYARDILTNLRTILAQD